MKIKTDFIGRVSITTKNKTIHYHGLRFYFMKIKYLIAYHGRFNEHLSDRAITFMVKYFFCLRMGYNLDLDHPESFNQKVSWLKLNYHNPLITQCADKYRAREYIADKIGEKYLTDLIAVYDSATDIVWDKLPNQFALKINWGCKQNIICTDKSKLNIRDATNKLRKWMQPHGNHYYHRFEWGYKDIVPEIVAEKYIPEMASGANEYEFFCMNGEPTWVMLRSVGPNGEHQTSDLDMDWNPLPFVRQYPRPERVPTRPRDFKKMLELCRALAAPFPLVRINIIKTADGLKIGELTFTPGNGTNPFHPREWDFKMGERLQLRTEN